MSGREFVVMWACVIGLTLAMVGWVTLCVGVLFPHNPAAAIASGVGVPVAAMIFGTWWLEFR